MQSISISVQNMAVQQNPVAYAREQDDLDRPFLSDELRPFQLVYEIRYDYEADGWILYGGAIHGIRPSAGGARSTVRLLGDNREVEIKETFADRSLLEPGGMSGLDEEAGYQAVITGMALGAVYIGLGAEIRPQPDLLRALEQAFAAGHFNYFEIDFERIYTAPDFEIHLDDAGCFFLTRAHCDFPLFKRENDALKFLRNVDAVGKWFALSNLKNPAANITAADFVFTVEKVEGQKFTADNAEEWDGFAGERVDALPGNAIEFLFKADLQPAFRMRIAISNTSSLQQCFVGALHLDSRFTILTNLVEPDKGRLVKGGSPIDLTWAFKGFDHVTIPLTVSPVFKAHGIDITTDYLLLVISSFPVSLERYRQDGLLLDNQLRMALKNDDGVKEAVVAAIEEKRDWAVFQFPFRIVS